MTQLGFASSGQLVLSQEFSQLLCTGRRGLLNLLSSRCLPGYFELVCFSAYGAPLQAGTELFYLSASLQGGMLLNCSGRSVTIGSGQCRIRNLWLSVIEGSGQ